MLVIQITRHSKRVMKCFYATLLDFEHWEIDNPYELKTVFVNQVHFFVLCDEDTETAHIIPYGFLVTRTEEDDVAHFHTGTINKELQIFRAEELLQRPFETVLFHLEVSEPFGTEFTYIVFETFHFTFREYQISTRNTERFDTVHFRISSDRCKYFIITTCKNINHINHFKIVAKIRFIGAIPFHRIRVLDTIKRRHHCMTGTREHTGNQLFGNTNNIFLVAEAHFYVDLGKFRLTICTQIFVTETFCYLKIAIKSAHH